ncbi:nuclease-related domain-containing protein [Flavobacterium sp. 7A]|uniref:nuclease-related domain-containing protein n=1 Tax=Flavobacterium sp. 7A TaxID=2940571 RepID=UPI002226EC47|nr:NERD domain-containing protein [Flavobacterium sp. 7A]MCW2119644.1 hypothetical protein [Flavobacterium sp. 7A]
MCIVYNTIGALSHIEAHLAKNNIDEFNSIPELIKYEKDYTFLKEQIILKHRDKVRNEKQVLEEEIPLLTEEILNNKLELNQKLEQKLSTLNAEVEKLFLPNSNISTILKDLFLNSIVWSKIWSAPILTRFNLFLSTRKLNKILKQKNSVYEFLKYNLEEAVNQSSSSELQNIVRKGTAIKEINNFIYGAIGEHKVTEALSKLSNDYILINDFTCSFQPALFRSNQNDYIKSVQIDHIVIAPSGVFLIETKNWSENSMKNKELRSPVQQVLRANFALFKILEGNTLNNHNWGHRKIPVKNIITFINQKPTEEFQFVKILSLNELVNYITYFPPCFSKEEVQKIADYLLRNCDTKNNYCKLRID